MAAGTHVQMLVDVVVPDSAPDVMVYLADLIELLNAELHRQGLMESVWVVPA